MSIVIDVNVHLLSELFQFLFVIFPKIGHRVTDGNQVLNILCKTLLLHCTDLLGVVRCDNECCHLRLVQDEVNLLYRHSIEKSDCSDTLVHAAKD